ncbi:TetR/AcrR family transcriptional regulator [Nocardioides massiliensis]|uniref:AcrR family transcriptional regulator n=1 Tax=Nocardioides massiliensis TaxID=1325935 RepID=A0ABT9NR58_9ACTN|nr:TetR/AcrR family transcriptional regulator [Nocardioides massiliensis]MDP9822290.1 AcrR family transcriptional regulator [Nocardioides massiliensis]
MANARIPSLLSPARAATREKLIEAALELATEGGYDAVGIRPVAARAGVSVPTVYQHVSSKDQLLVEALMTLGVRSTEGVRQRPPADASPADRLVRVFQRIMKAAAAKPLLYAALYRAYAASGSLVGAEGVVGFGPEQAGWIGETLRAGDHEGYTDEELDAAARILSMQFLGAMVGVAAGRPVPDALAVLDEATHRLLPPR